MRAVADDDFCYLTTTGRRTRRPHEIEIWFAGADSGDGGGDGGDDGSTTLYLLAGGGRSSDWVRNLEAGGACAVRLGRRDADPRPARGRVLARDDPEDEVARRLVFAKYQPRNGGDLSAWREAALAAATDLAGGG